MKKRSNLPDKEYKVLRMLTELGKRIDVRILTEDDLDEIDDKMENLAHSIMIDFEYGGSDDSDTLEPMPLQKVITNMNDAITKLSQTKPEPEIIEDTEIDDLFS